jgi:hypothetical protein
MLVLKSDRSSGNVGVGVEVGSDVIGQAVSVEPVDDGVIIQAVSVHGSEIFFLKNKLNTSSTL